MKRGIKLKTTTTNRVPGASVEDNNSRLQTVICKQHQKPLLLLWLLLVLLLLGSVAQPSRCNSLVISEARQDTAESKLTELLLAQEADDKHLERRYDAELARLFGALPTSDGGGGVNNTVTADKPANELTNRSVGGLRKQQLAKLLARPRNILSSFVPYSLSKQLTLKRPKNSLMVGQDLKQHQQMHKFGVPARLIAQQQQQNIAQKRRPPPPHSPEQNPKPSQPARQKPNQHHLDLINLPVLLSSKAFMGPALVGEPMRRHKTPLSAQQHQQTAPLLYIGKVPAIPVAISRAPGLVLHQTQSQNNTTASTKAKVLSSYLGEPEATAPGPSLHNKETEQALQHMDRMLKRDFERYPSPLQMSKLAQPAPISVNSSRMGHPRPFGKPNLASGEQQAANKPRWSSQHRQAQLINHHESRRDDLRGPVSTIDEHTTIASLIPVSEPPDSSSDWIPTDVPRIRDMPRQPQLSPPANKSIGSYHFAQPDLYSSSQSSDDETSERDAVKEAGSWPDTPLERPQSAQRAQQVASASASVQAPKQPAVDAAASHNSSLLHQINTVAIQFAKIDETSRRSQPHAFNPDSNPKPDPKLNLNENNNNNQRSSLGRQPGIATVLESASLEPADSDGELAADDDNKQSQRQQPPVATSPNSGSIAALELSNTLRKLRETRNRIKQLQAELNATDPKLLHLFDQQQQHHPMQTTGESELAASSSSDETVDDDEYDAGGEPTGAGQTTVTPLASLPRMLHQNKNQNHPNHQHQGHPGAGPLDRNVGTSPWLPAFLATNSNRWPPAAILSPFGLHPGPLASSTRFLGKALNGVASNALIGSDAETATGDNSSRARSQHTSLPPIVLSTTMKVAGDRGSQSLGAPDEQPVSSNSPFTPIAKETASQANKTASWLADGSASAGLPATSNLFRLLGPNHLLVTGEQNVNTESVGQRRQQQQTKMIAQSSHFPFITALGGGQLLTSEQAANGSATSWQDKLPEASNRLTLSTGNQLQQYQASESSAGGETIVASRSHQANGNNISETAWIPAQARQPQLVATPGLKAGETNATITPVTAQSGGHLSRLFRELLSYPGKLLGLSQQQSPTQTTTSDASSQDGHSVQTRGRSLASGLGKQHQLDSGSSWQPMESLMIRISASICIVALACLFCILLLMRRRLQARQQSRPKKHLRNNGHHRHCPLHASGCSPQQVGSAAFKPREWAKLMRTRVRPDCANCKLRKPACKHRHQHLLRGEQRKCQQASSASPLSPVSSSSNFNNCNDRLIFDETMRNVSLLARSGPTDEPVQRFCQCDSCSSHHGSCLSSASGSSRNFVISSDGQQLAGNGQSRFHSGAKLPFGAASSVNRLLIQALHSDGGPATVPNGARLAQIAESERLHNATTFTKQQHLHDEDERDAEPASYFNGCPRLEASEQSTDLRQQQQQKCRPNNNNKPARRLIVVAESPGADEPAAGRLAANDKLASAAPSQHQPRCDCERGPQVQQQQRQQQQIAVPKVQNNQKMDTKHQQKQPRLAGKLAEAAGDVDGNCFKRQLKLEQQQQQQRLRVACCANSTDCDPSDKQKCLRTAAKGSLLEQASDPDGSKGANRRSKPAGDAVGRHNLNLR